MEYHYELHQNCLNGNVQQDVQTVVQKGINFRKITVFA